MVAVACGVPRPGGATEGGQGVNGAGDLFYLVPRQFAGAGTLQDSMVLIHGYFPLSILTWGLSLP